MDAVIFLAHGSPRPDWRAPLDELVSAVTGEHAEERTVLAFMEHCPPTLLEAAQMMIEKGTTRVVIFPLFISSRGHVSREVAQQVAEVRNLHPHIDFEVMPALAHLDPIVSALRGLVAQVHAK
mgnify:CR=1 FL=1